MHLLKNVVRAIIEPCRTGWNDYCTFDGVDLGPVGTTSDVLDTKTRRSSSLDSSGRNPVSAPFAPLASLDKIVAAIAEEWDIRN